MSAARLQFRINDAIPIEIRPTGGSTIERLGEGHDGTYILLFFATSISEEKAKFKGQLTETVWFFDIGCEIFRTSGTAGCSRYLFKSPLRRRTLHPITPRASAFSI